MTNFLSCLKLCGILKTLFCWLILCIYTLQDSSVSIFDRLFGLITDSLLCTRPNFRDYPITACVPANKGASLPFTNWNEEWCQCSKERPITENYWIEKEWKKKKKKKGYVVCLGLLVDFLWFHQKKRWLRRFPQTTASWCVCRRALLPKISEKR